MDRECDQAYSRLMDALCTWERETGRRTTILLIPHLSDEKIVVAVDGKPAKVETTEDLGVLLHNALTERPERAGLMTGLLVMSSPLPRTRI
jgi:hypothetical protein